MEKKKFREIFEKIFKDMLIINPNMDCAHEEEDFVVENFVTRVLRVLPKISHDNMDMMVDWYFTEKRNKEI